MSGENGGDLGYLKSYQAVTTRSIVTT